MTLIRYHPELFGEHMLPFGTVHMTFALHHAPIFCIPSTSPGSSGVWSGGMVHGSQWTYYKSGPKPAGATIGVSFRPGAAGTILDLLVTELTDRHLPTDALWGTGARDLRERLRAAQSPAATPGALQISPRWSVTLTKPI